MVRLPDGRLQVHTVDFFTPIVDDPRTYGAIAAANALSDVYAMGAEPLSALNVVVWPQDQFPEEVLADILAGGAEKVREAGALLVGGHTVTGPELKYGMAVTGLVDADRLWTNAGARPGDALVLTKPLGTGIVTTAIKRGKAPDAAIEAATRWMATLHAETVRLARSLEVHAATDVTGFGLAGHAWEMARASGVVLRLEADRLPVLPHARSLARKGHLTRGDKETRAWLGDRLRFEDVPGELQSICVDPQTSGGLLLAMPPDDAQRLSAQGGGHVIGSVQPGPPSVRVTWRPA